MTINVKICGLKTKEAVQQAVSNKADFIGFVFFKKSPRFVTSQEARNLSQYCSNSVKKVGVFVNPTDEELIETTKHVPLDYIQLHGSEDLNRIKEVKKITSLPIIKAIKVKTEKDILRSKDFHSETAFILFDAAPTPKDLLPGGNGFPFDWRYLKKEDLTMPWFLAGGLSIDNIDQALQETKADFIDISSGLENNEGQKDLKMIEDFLIKVKNIKK